MDTNETIYDDFDVPRAINAAGTKTRLGGPLMRPEAVDAMRQAASSSARISDLQASASRLISDATGAEAGYVVSGASACLTMAAAACIAGSDYGSMTKLPKTDGIPSEIIVPRTHRNSYDIALQAAGADLVDIGNADYSLGVASTNVHPWEIEAAINDETAAVTFVPKKITQVNLETVVDIAHAHDVPVIVDAAATLPPRSNLSKHIETGADVVVFSGGKAIRGPQSTGIIAGRSSLIHSIALQHLDMDMIESLWDPPEEIIQKERLDGVPRMGIGRGFKVGKEEIIGVIKALELFLEEDEAVIEKDLFKRATLIRDKLNSSDSIEASIPDHHPGDDSSYQSRSDVIPKVVVQVEKNEDEIDVLTLVKQLRDENPRIIVGTEGIENGQLTINPFSISDDDAEYIVDRILDRITSRK